MKEELCKLEELVRDLGNLYDDNMVITASVLIQNIAFNTDKWKKNEEEVKPYLNILKKMKEYNKSNHIIQWAYTEVDMIVTCYFMSKMF
jgi:hypothetical protein